MFPFRAKKNQTMIFKIFIIPLMIKKNKSINIWKQKPLFNKIEIIYKTN